MAHEPDQLAALPWIAFRSLVADFRAAVWCENRRDAADDAALLVDFHQIHESFLRAIGRRRPGLFGGVDRKFLIDIVRKWVAMYARGVADARARFPRTDDSADLIVHGRNWSEKLDMAYEGLDRLDVVSRYAEYWAERTVTWVTTHERGQGVQETYEDRMQFIGTGFYVMAETMVHTGEVMFIDGADNGMPSFDIWQMFGALPDPAGVEQHSARLGWRVRRLDPRSFATLWEAARRLSSSEGEVRDGL